VRPYGTLITESMPAAYGLMTDDELKAIRAYLRTVPAKGKKTRSQDGQAE
jgi:mono/diheme cytochrome c family protein